jgi:hypothetical protein
MRIVAVADTHTFHDDLGVIPEGDVFLHAGDLCRGGRLDELRTAAAWLRRRGGARRRRAARLTGVRAEELEAGFVLAAWTVLDEGPAVCLVW